MSTEEFQNCRRGGHFRYRNGTIMELLSLFVAPMPPIKFRLYPTYGLRGDVVWRISRWPPWRSSWTSEQNYFSNSESLCHSPIQLVVWEELSIKELQDGRRGGHLGYQTGTIIAILIYVNPMPPIKFRLKPIYGFSNSEYPCSHNAHQVSTQSGGDVKNVKS